MRRARSACPLALLACCAAACTQSGSGVLLTIDPAGLMPDELDVSATYDGHTVSRVVTVGGGMLTMLAQLPDESTSVVFAVAGKRSGQLVGQGKSGPVAVSAHHIASATVTLGGGSGGDLGLAGGTADLLGRDAGGDGGGDGGWTLQHGALPPMGATINAMWGSSGSDVYAACSFAGNVNLLHSTDHGAHWIGQDAHNSMVNLNGVGGSDSTDVYLVGDNATVLHGSGTSWSPPLSQLPVSPSTKLLGVFAISSADVYVVGDNDTIMHYAGGWVLQTAVGSKVFHAVWGVSGHAWAVGSAGTIMETAGSGWTDMTSNTTVELRAVFGTSATDIWAAGDGVLLHNDGVSKSWTVVPNVFSPIVSIHAMHAAPGGPLLAVGSAWTILRHDATGWTMESSGLPIDAPSGDLFNGVYVPSALEAFAGGDGLVIVHRP